MAIALVQQAAAGSADSNAVTTSGVDTTGANLLVIGLSSYQSATRPTISDNKGNTWTALTNYETSALERHTIFYAKNAIVGSGHTFTASGTACFPAICAMAFSGADASNPFDVENGATHGIGGGTTIATGSVSPSLNNELVFTAQGGATTGSSMTIDSGFTLGSTQVNLNGATNFSGACAYLIQTTKGAVSPTWTRGAGSSDYMSTAIATFKAASSGGPFPFYAARRLSGGFNPLSGGTF